MKLAHLLGLSDTEIEHICPLPDAQTYTDEHYYQCISGDFSFALGMISLIEEFTTPEFTLIFKAFLRSCRVGLYMNAEDFVIKGGAEYFTVNIADDERHRGEMPRLVATYLHNIGVNLTNSKDIKKGLEPVLAGVKHSANLRQKFFEGIYSFVKGGGTFKKLVAY